MLLQSLNMAAQSSLGGVTSYAVSGNAVTVQCQNGQLVVAQCARHAWKVSSLPTGKSLSDERATVTLTHQHDNDATVSATDGGSSITITNGSSTVTVDKATAVLSFADGTTTRLTELRGIDNSQTQKSISFAAQGDDAFYGGGYNGKNTNMEGKTLTMTNTQNYNWDRTIAEGQPNNICVPFIVSSNGYGILFEDHYIGGIIKPSASGTTFSSDSPTPISYVYVGSEKGDMAGVMETYGDVAGYHELPPYWALGYITSRYGYHSQAEAEEVIASLKSHNMPVSGIIMDLFWEGEKQNGMGNLDWYRTEWPTAEAMMSNFKSQGVHTTVITEPYFAEESSNYSTLASLGLFADADCPDITWISQKKVGIIDFLNPSAIDWMWSFYKARTDEGVDGWWLDLGEPERIHDDVIHYDGSTVSQAHNEFGLDWIAGVWKKWKTAYPDQRPLFLPRAGTSGMQRYGTFPWTGDIARSWDGLKAQVPALVNGGMSGLGYLSSDIGGFITDPTNASPTVVPYTNPELYLRWFQLGVFSPVLRTHSQYKPEPYHDEYAKIRDAVRDLMNLRYRMLPYNYSSAWRNATKGTPITMPVDFYSKEPVTATRKNDEYLFGPNILVAPIMDTATVSRDVYLPSGEWIDPVTLERYEGGSTISFTSSDFRLPHYYRCGAFTPFFTQTEYTNTENINTAALDIFYPLSNTGQDGAAFTFYDDDKTSANVGDRYETVTFSAQESGGTHTVTMQSQCAATYMGRPAMRTMHFVIPMGRYDAASSTVSAVSASSASSGFVKSWCDAARNVLYVDANLSATSSQAQCSFAIACRQTGIQLVLSQDSQQAGADADGNADVNGNTYNLAGQRVQGNAKGILIINGHKVVK